MGIVHGPVTRKLRPDLIKDVASHQFFRSAILHGQYMAKITDKWLCEAHKPGKCCRCCLKSEIGYAREPCAKRSQPLR